MSLLESLPQTSPRPGVSSPHPPDFVAVIARQCERHADREAVVASDGRLTYRDLAIRVAGLARRLEESGVRAGSLVGICMPRGADELTAMLAVLTIGAAYVPLDPSQPAHRLAMILDDAQPPLVITRQRQSLPDRGIATLTVGDGTDSPGGTPTEPTWTPCGSPEALAYVLFTSGSTGRPKGVEIPRRAVSNLLAAMVRRPGLRESDVLLAVSTSMFDIAVLEMFGPLCVGGTVHIVDSETIRDGRLLRAVLEREPVSVMQATPTMWHMLVEAGWSGDGRLRMLVGGEPLSPHLARQLLRRGEVWNMYGPTETTVWSTCKRIDDPDQITIGRPIDNTDIHVLDESGAVLPRGITGELGIGGAGLARGYLGRPDLTAERFIQNPAGPPGARIYRTGDLVELLDNGELRYLGRSDQQIKIRGFRVELGEIEHALTDLDCVSRAVVVKWEPAGATPVLVAYVVPSPGAAFDPHELSGQLRERLPHYMVPGRFIRMSSFPLTVNRKIDRTSLPDPVEALDDSQRRPRNTSPGTDTEKRVYRIWSEVLSRPNIALDDDFFDLGGQSILAVRICDRIHRALAVDLPVAALLDHRTISDLSAHIDGLRAAGGAQQWSSVVPISVGGSDPAIFCVSGIGGNPMTFLDLADAIGAQRPFYGLQHQGVDGRRRPYRSIEEMARAFVSDIRAVQNTGPYILAGYSGGGLAAFEAARLMTADGDDVPLVILLDTERPGLSDWSPDERARQHWARMQDGGTRYLMRRAGDRARSSRAEVAQRIRAGLAHLSPYTFRMAAVEMAGRRAAAAYDPLPYSGDVLLFQSDPDPGSESGIPRRRHESNGWRDLVGGQFDVVPVPAGHLEIVEGRAASLVGREITRVLSAKVDISDRGD